MTAAAALALARQHSVAVRADGDRLMLDAPASPPAVVLDAIRAAKPELLRVLAASAALGPQHADPEPTAPCPACACGLWWRRSILSSGPGPWCCSICNPAPADVWQDAHAVPGGRMPDFPPLGEASEPLTPLAALDSPADRAAHPEVGRSDRPPRRP